MKTVRQFLFVMTLMSYLLAVLAFAPVGTAYAGQIQSGRLIAQSSGIFPLPSAEEYGNVPTPNASQSAQQQFQTLMWGVVQNVRFIIGAVAVLMIVYAGFKMVTAYGSEEVYAKQRNTILYAIVGLAIVALSGEMSQILAVSCPDFQDPTLQNFQCTQGGFLKDPNAIVRTSVIFNQRTKLIITFIKYFIGGVAVLMIVRNGMRLITMGSDESKIAEDKKNLFYSIFGLLLIILADTVINQVFYKVDLTRYPSVGGAQPGVDAARGVKEIVGFTNFVVSIIGPLAVLVLVAGGVMYMTAAGDESKMTKAKRVIISALIGILIIYGAFAIVSTFISGQIGSAAVTT
jgi:hypothetical protein